MSPVIRRVRTIILIGLAFILGVGFERFQRTDRCLDAGGTMKAGLCREAKDE